MKSVDKIVKRNFVIKKLSTFYEMSAFCDCTFQIGTVQIKAHKLVLTCFSPVFERMFYGPWATSDVIFIEDIEVDTFRNLLRYFYYDELTIESIQQAWKLYAAANKYLVDDVKYICVDYVERHLTLMNLAMTYEYAEFYGLQRLQQMCKEDLVLYFRGVLLFTDYHMQANTLVSILESYPSFILRNMNKNELSSIVQGVVDWAMQECHLRNVDVTIDSVSMVLNQYNLGQFLNYAAFDLTVANGDFIQSVLKQLYLDCDLYYDNTKMSRKVLKPKIRRFNWLKLAERIDLDRNTPMLVEVMSYSRLAIFSLIVVTPTVPPDIIVDQKEKSYLGAIRICLFNSKTNEQIIKPVIHEGWITYGSECKIDLDEVVILDKNSSYGFKIYYTASNQRRLSVNRCHVDTTVDNEKQIEIYNLFGTVLIGMISYRVS